MAPGFMVVTDMDKTPSDLLNKLFQVIEERKQAEPESSYVADLYDRGLDAILKKVGEEAVETLLACKQGDPKEIIHETADLWFHTMVMLSHEGLHVNDILSELERRFGLSGLEEKANRSDKG